MNDKLKILALGDTGRLLTEVLTEYQRDLADIRRPLNVKPEIQTEVRLATIDIIEEFKNKLKVFSGEAIENNDDFS